MSERVPVRLPERIFLRRVDVNDLDWDGAEGDVHCLYSPNTIIATHMDAFIPEARHKELMERAVGEARVDVYKEVAENMRINGIGLLYKFYSDLSKAARAARSTGGE